MGMVAMMVMWPGLFEQLFRSLNLWRLHMKFITTGPVVSEEKSFELVNGRMIDG